MSSPARTLTSAFFARLSGSLYEVLPRLLLMPVMLLAVGIGAASVAHAQLTWQPATPAANGNWNVGTADYWEGSSGVVVWDQTQAGVFTLNPTAFPVANIPIQAGIQATTGSAPAFMYTGGGTPSSLDPFQNTQYYAGLDLTTGAPAPVYSFNLVGSPQFSNPSDGNMVNTVLMQGSGGFTKAGTGLLTLRNPFSTFEGNIVVNQGGLNNSSSPPQPTTFSPATTGVNVYNYFNAISQPVGTPQPSAFGRADIPRSVTINAGAYLVPQGNDSFGAAGGPASQITLNVNGGRVWTDFIGGYSSTFGGIDPARPSGGQRGPVTSMGPISLSASGTMNGSWAWMGPSGTATQLQPVASGSQAWLLRGTVTSSGTATLSSQALSRGYHAGMHLYDTPFVVTDGTLNVPGQFFNQASQTTNPTAGFSKSGAGTMVISGNNWHSGTTSVAAGTLVSAGRKSPLKVSPTVVSGSAATLELTTSQTTGGLTVSQGQAKLPTSSFETVSTPTLVVNESAGGGRLDVGRGRVVIAPGGIAEADLRNDLLAGRGTGNFAGASGIVTSGGAAGSSTNPVVGYRVTTGSTVVAWAANGDANLDGRVSQTDVNLLISGGKFNAGGTSAVWSQGDFNYNGQVTQTDINLMIGSQLFNQGDYRPAAQAGPPVVQQNFSTNPNWSYFQRSGTSPVQGYATWTGTSPMGTGGAVGGTMHVDSNSNNRIGTYFADTTSFSGSNALNYADTFSAKGNIYLSNTNFNGGLGIGFFNWQQVNGVTGDGTVGTSGTTQGSQSTSFIGIQMAEPNSPAVTGPFRTWLYAAQNNRETNEYSQSFGGGEVSSRSATSGTSMVQNTIVPFEFQYAGQLNGSGLITGKIGDQDLSLTVPTRTYFGDWQMTAFGLVTGLGGSSVNAGLTTGIWIDNVVYGFGALSSLPSVSGLADGGTIAAVPEPGTVGLAVVGAVAAVAAARIRRSSRRRSA